MRYQTATHSKRQPSPVASQGVLEERDGISRVSRHAVEIQIVICENLIYYCDFLDRFPVSKSNKDLHGSANQNSWVRKIVL